MLRLLALITSAVVLAQVSSAQTIEEIRNQLRNELRQDQFAGGLVTLIVLSNEMELSGINYKLDDDVNTEISALVLPFNYTLHPFENPKLGLYTEGVIGCSVMEQNGPDIFNGDVPALATSFDTEWTTYGGLLGIGPERHLSDELSVAAIAQIGASYIENDTDYAGPGSGITPQIFDGLLFNWNAWAVTYGLAARMHWRRHLGQGKAVQLTARYDVRWTESFDTDDDAQEFSTMSELTTFRMQYSAPTGLHLGEYPLGWRVHTGLSVLVASETSDGFGAIEVGGGFDLLTKQDLPIVDGVTAGGAVFLGDGVAGWSVGVGVVF